MAPHDQHCAVIGLAWVSTSIPLVSFFLSSLQAVSCFQFSEDEELLLDFHSHGISLLNSAASGWISVAPRLTRMNFRSRTISLHSGFEKQIPGASGSLRNRESCRADK